MELKEAIEHVRINTDISHFDIQGPGEDEMMNYFNAISLVLAAAEKWVNGERTCELIEKHPLLAPYETHWKCSECDTVTFTNYRRYCSQCGSKITGTRNAQEEK